MERVDKNKPIEILMIEDNPGDISLTTAAFSESKLNINLNTVFTGEEALYYLRKEGKYNNSKRPDLIILDLNLPGKHGQEVLREIKKDQRFIGIPVVILTSSSDEEDVLKSYKFHANCYIIKPFDFEKFIKIVKSIENFWINVVKRPSE